MPEWTQRDRVLVSSILLIASLLLFARFDDRFLWQDEAETALLGQSVLTYGTPTAFDGRNIISQEGRKNSKLRTIDGSGHPGRGSFRWRVISTR
jgi:hypothetical protein